MRLRRLAVQGWRHHAEVDLSIEGNLNELPPPPLGAAAHDALAMLRAALDPSAALAGLVALGIPAAGVEHALDDQLTDHFDGLDPDATAGLFAPGDPRSLVVHLDAEPDPPLYRRLREAAVKVPELAAEVAAGGLLHLRVGWLLNRAGSHITSNPLALRIGGVQLSTASHDRMAWVPGLLHEIGRRVLTLDLNQPISHVADHLLAAQLSDDAAQRRAVQRAAATLASPPFSLGELQIVRRGAVLDLCFGPDLTPCRVLGPRAAFAVRLVHAVLVLEPDVLCVHGHRGDPYLRWAAERTDGDGATLEQLLIVGPPG